MTRLLSIKKLQKAYFRIHADAEKAFQFYQSMNFQFDPTLLHINTSAPNLLGNQTLHAVELSEDSYAIFSGFEHRFFNINQANAVGVCVLVHRDDLDGNQIRELAWCGVLRSVLSSIRSDSLGHLYEQINQLAPSEVISMLFGQSHLTEELLAKVSGTSRSTIAKQRERLKHSPEPPPTAPTIFEQLVSGPLNE